jgi:hypothetical protein
MLLALALLLASLAGGCKVESGSSAQDSAGIVVNDEAHLDLRTPPTREQLGVEPGADSASYVRSSGDVTIDVDLTLPEGGRLHVPAIALHAAFSDIIGNEIVVNRVEPSLDAAERAVLDSGDLGLDVQRVRSVVAAWRHGERDLGTANVFRGGRFGYLGIEVEMRPNGAGGTVLINYTVSWPGAAGSSSPSPPPGPATPARLTLDEWRSFDE